MIRQLNLLIAGDVHGHWSRVAAASQAANEVLGQPVDLIVSVGDAEALRDELDLAGVHGPLKYRKQGEFPQVVSGEIHLGAPVVFIGGNHSPYPTLDAAEHAAHTWPIPWADGVEYLGRAGARALPVGDETLRVAWVSGIHSPIVSPGTPQQRSSGEGKRPNKRRTYYTYSELDATRRAASKLGHIDLLITHDWPAGIGTDRDGEPTGDERLAELSRALRPTLHVCGHMHHRLSAELFGVPVEAAGHSCSGPDGVILVEFHPGGITVRDPLDV